MYSNSLDFYFRFYKQNKKKEIRYNKKFIIHANDKAQECK